MADRIEEVAEGQIREVAAETIVEEMIPEVDIPEMTAEVAAEASGDKN